MTRRVTVLTHRLASGAPSGVGRYARELIDALGPIAPAAGWRIDVGTSSERARPRLPDGVELHRLPRPRKVTHALLAAGMPLRLDRWIGRPDLIHQLNPWVPLPTTAPSIVTIHDLMPVLHPEWFDPRHRWRFRAALRRAVRHSFIVCDSQHVADLVCEHLDVPVDRVRAIHLGVRDVFRRPVPGHRVEAVCSRHGIERGRYLLALGVMSAREDPSVVLEALARSSVDLGEVALVVTGPDRHGSERARNTAGALGIADRVRFAGFVDDDDLAPLLAGACALVHPSRDEGFGLTPLEAMAVGTPVIASGAGSLPEVVGPGARLVDPDDTGAWQAAIDDVVGDRDTRDRLIAAGRAHQAQFTWDRTARRTLALYDEVLRGA